MAQSSWVKTTCPYCGVGCGVEARKDSAGKVEIRGDKQHPANFGRLCSKGLALADTLVPQGRLAYPEIANQRVDWDVALDTVSTRFNEIIDQHGPDAVAFYVSGQLLTEDYYVANKLMKGFIGSGNIDTNSRLCMSSTVAGHKRAFGADTVPGCYQDLEVADLVILTGSNLAWCHPVLFQRLKQAKLDRPHMKVVVIDPRRTDSCDIADLHLQVMPGSDVALFNGLLWHLADKAVQDEVFVANATEGMVDAINAAAKQGASIETVAEVCGVPVETITAFYALFAETQKTVTVFSQGVNQSSQGVDKVNAIINCHLYTGRIGKPGMGPFSVTGQPNAMGGREVGGLANTLAAHMEFGDQQASDDIKGFWHSDRIATKPGLKAVDLFEAVEQGSVKAVWVMATNPVVSLPQADRVKAALEKCEFLVVSDCVDDTDTLRLADVKLPAQGWSEKSGTVTNSERRLSRQRQILAPAGEARADWWIICEVAKRMGFNDAFSYQDEAEIFDEHARLSALNNDGSRDFNIAGLVGLSAEEYDQLRPVQWPLTNKRDLSQHKRMFADRKFFTANGKARFVPVSWQPPKSKTCDRFPLVLNSGRIRDQWHTQTRTGLAPKLSAHLPEPFVQLHTLDAAALGIEEGSLVELTSAHGNALVRAQINQHQRRGELFVPIHWTGVSSSQGRISVLFEANVDPLSGQPESKFTPVSAKPWRENASAFVISDKPLELASEYWVRQTVSGGYLYRLAGLATASQLKAMVTEQLDEGGRNQSLSFTDASNERSRVVYLDQGELKAAVIAWDGQSSVDLEWMAQVWRADSKANAIRALLSGEPVGSLAQGRIVCACKQVGEKTILDAIQSGSASDLQALQEQTCAGTGCGSCVPELKQFLETNLAHDTPFVAA